MAKQLKMLSPELLKSMYELLGVPYPAGRVITKITVVLEVNQPVTLTEQCSALEDIPEKEEPRAA